MNKQIEDLERALAKREGRRQALGRLVKGSVAVGLAGLGLVRAADEAGAVPAGCIGCDSGHTCSQYLVLACNDCRDLLKPDRYQVTRYRCSDGMFLSRYNTCGCAHGICQGRCGI